MAPLQQEQPTSGAVISTSTVSPSPGLTTLLPKLAKSPCPRRRLVPTENQNKMKAGGEEEEEKRQKRSIQNLAQEGRVGGGRKPGCRIMYLPVCFVCIALISRPKVFKYLLILGSCTGRYIVRVAANKTLQTPRFLLLSLKHLAPGLRDRWSRGSE